MYEWIIKVGFYTGVVCIVGLIVAILYLELIDKP